VQRRNEEVAAGRILSTRVCPAISKPPTGLIFGSCFVICHLDFVILDPLTQYVPEGVSPAWAMSALVLAVLVTGVAKSGFGGGIGILAVPLMASAIDADNALGVMLPILIAADVAAVWQHRRQLNAGPGGGGGAGVLRPCLLGGLVGVIAASGLLKFYQGAAGFGALLSVTVGGVCLALVALQVFRVAGGRVPRVPPGRRAAVGVGGVAGFVSALAHAAGPVMSVYLLDQRMKKAQLVATLAVFFFVLNLMKLPGYLALGVIDRGTLRASALLLPLVPVGAVLGLWLHRRCPERPFTLIMYAGAAAAGLRMIYRAFA